MQELNYGAVADRERLVCIFSFYFRLSNPFQANTKLKLTQFTFPSEPAQSHLPERAQVTVSEPLLSRASLSWWQVADIAIDSYPESPTSSPTRRSPSCPSRPDPAPPLYADTIIPYDQLRHLSGGQNSTACGFIELKSNTRPITPPSSTSLLPTPPTTPPLCIVKRSSTVSKIQPPDIFHSTPLVPVSPSSLRRRSSLPVSPSQSSSSLPVSPSSMKRSSSRGRILEEKENVNFETSGKVARAIAAKVLSLRDSSPGKNKKPRKDSKENNGSKKTSSRSRHGSRLDVPLILASPPKPDSWDIFHHRAATRKQLGLPCLVKLDGEDVLSAIVE